MNAAADAEGFVQEEREREGERRSEQSPPLQSHRHRSSAQEPRRSLLSFGEFFFLGFFFFFFVFLNVAMNSVV